MTSIMDRWIGKGMGFTTVNFPYWHRYPYGLIACLPALANHKVDCDPKWLEVESSADILTVSLSLRLLRETRVVTKEGDEMETSSRTNHKLLGPDSWFAVNGQSRFLRHFDATRAHA